VWCKEEKDKEKGNKKEEDNKKEKDNKEKEIIIYR